MTTPQEIIKLISEYRALTSHNPDYLNKAVSQAKIVREQLEPYTKRDNIPESTIVLIKRCLKTLENIIPDNPQIQVTHLDANRQLIKVAGFLASEISRTAKLQETQVGCYGGWSNRPVL